MKTRITFENGRKLIHARAGDVVFLPDKTDGLSPINMEVPYLVCQFPGLGPPPPSVHAPYLQISTKGERLFLVNLCNGEVRPAMPHLSTICRTATKAILNLRADGD